MTDVLQVVTGMFVARPTISLPSLSLVSTTNEVLQVNDGTSGAEATTRCDRLKVFPVFTAPGASATPSQTIDAVLVPLYVTSHANCTPSLPTVSSRDAFVAHVKLFSTKEVLYKTFYNRTEF